MIHLLKHGYFQFGTSNYQRIRFTALPPWTLIPLPHSGTRCTRCSADSRTGGHDHQGRNVGTNWATNTRSMGWFKGKSTANPGFSQQIWWFPVDFPLNLSNENTVQWLTMCPEGWHGNAGAADRGPDLGAEGSLAHMDFDGQENHGDPWRAVSRASFGSAKVDTSMGGCTSQMSPWWPKQSSGLAQMLTSGWNTARLHTASCGLVIGTYATSFIED